MERQCEWCGDPSGGRATCSSGHRGARWRWLNGVTGKGGAPPDAPLWPDSPLRGRMGEDGRRPQPLPVAPTQLGLAPEPGPRSGAKARSGLILSYPKAVNAAQDALRGYVMAQGCSAADADEEIEEALRGALSDKMRAKLAARG